MSNSTASNSSGGIGFVGLLTILFIGLKLTGYIGWSWWWVLSPIWISFAVAFVFILIAAVVYASKGRRI
jgi:uncharacterized protein (DUF983 family)